MGSPADFDFWLGSWIVSWDDGASVGRNTVTRTHGGKVVTESFDGRPGTELVGTSVSVYDEEHDLWRQTWVDDQGSYFALQGRFEHGEMTLLCDRHGGAAGVVYRMRFTDIAADSFTWSWERSTDTGKTFELAWQLAYTRETSEATEALLNPASDR
jgi:hypothetical protein